MKKENLSRICYRSGLLIFPAAVFLAALLSFFPSEGADRNPKPLRPVSTYSIVALDKETGQLGVAVQSHWFSVGSIVSWAEAGVGAVATQSFVDPGYGALGLEMMRAGKSAEQALNGLLKSDRTPEVRQVAMVDASGLVAVHTGKNCIAEAGHYQGDGFSCQANMMLKNTVWQAMARAYQNTRGELVDRLLAALEAAEKEGGDIRGRQSAAILVVSGKSSGVWWKDRVYDLRIEDHPEPIAEMKRLVQIAKAYNHMNRGDELLTENKVKEAMEEYSRAMELYSGNPELIFWPAVTMASTGRVEDSLPLFRKVFGLDPNWALLLQRLPAVGQFPKDRKLMKKILEQVPKK
ncbi:MAG TPA: Zn-dependent protease [Acidobacteria bacterium]|nr:Zn-dependent protease [Acidobacteriota bacterium]